VNALPALRLGAAVGALGMSVAHIPLMADHLEEAPYVGVGFVLLSIAGVLLAQLLIGSDVPEVWMATGAVAALALLGYALSRSVGLPQIHDEIGAWRDGLGLVAVTSEALMLGCAAVRLGIGGRPRRATRSPGRARVTAR